MTYHVALAMKTNEESRLIAKALRRLPDELRMMILAAAEFPRTEPSKLILKECWGSDSQVTKMEVN